MNVPCPTYHSRVPERDAPRVVIAPQSFKGSADAVAVASAIARGIRRVWPRAQCVELPLADGGEGTAFALVRATGGEMRQARVHDPLGREIDAQWGVLGDGITAVLEMAAASGLPLLREDERDPRITSTRGTGELILAAAASGAQRIVVGIGGSATNDGGAGMARAFGYRFFDAASRELPEGGAPLARLARIEGQTDPRLVRPAIDVACDVRNPLLGPEGATAVYGPQKGATPEIQRQLEGALARYADVVEAFVGRDVRSVAGAGAAGGLGAGLIAFLDARLVSGSALVLDAVGFDKRLVGADLVVAGEGGWAGAGAGGGEAGWGLPPCAPRRSPPIGPPASSSCASPKPLRSRPRTGWVMETTTAPMRPRSRRCARRWTRWRSTARSSSAKAR